MSGLGADGGPWGIEAASASKLIKALAQVPDGATLHKIYVTGNLGVMIEDELVAYIDLQTGEYVEATG